MYNAYALKWHTVGGNELHLIANYSTMSHTDHTRKFACTVKPHYSKSLKCGHFVLMDSYFVQAQIAVPLTAILKCRHLAIPQSRQVFLVPLVPGLYKIHQIMQTLACLSRKIVLHH